LCKFKCTRNKPKLKRTDPKSELVYLKNKDVRSNSTAHGQKFDVLSFTPCT
jgi:hypothetical protein